MRCKGRTITATAALVCIFVGLGSSTSAQESTENTTTETNAVETVDYSKGFQKFYTLGLPNVQDGEYVKLRVYTSGFDIDNSFFYELDLDGNAWLLEKDESGAGKFVVSNNRIAKVYELQELRKIMKAEQGEKVDAEKRTGFRMGIMPGSDTKGRLGGKWVAADIEDDIESTLDFLKKEKNKENRYSSFGHGDSVGRLFLSAIHYYSKGFKDQANQIVQLLFDISGDRRKVILQGLNAMANNEYQDIMARFAREKNFSELSSDLTQLLRKYRAGWRNGLAVKMVLDDVNERLANPEPPQIEGLAPENAALAKELAQTGSEPQVQDGRAYGGRHTLWVLNSQKDGAAHDNEKDLNVLAKIRRRGVKSIPLLLALLDDDYLTKLDSQQMGGISRTLYGWDTKLTEDMVKEHYQSMWRPLTRGDISHRLLNYIPLITGERSYGIEQKSKEELQALCEEWYAQNKDKTPVELARFYLDSTNNSQSREALSYLIEHGTTNDLAKVEEKLLDLAGSYESMNLIVSYVDARGSDAKRFVESFAESLETADENSMYKQAENQKHFERTVERLRKITSAPAPEELLADIVAGNKTVEEEREILMRGLGKKNSIGEVVSILLQATVDAEDSNIRAALVNLLPSAAVAIQYANNSPFSREAVDSEDEELDIATHADKWKILISDASIPRMGGPQKITIGDSSAYAMELLYGESGYNVQSKLDLLDTDLYAILAKRAQERLAGKDEDELTEIPSADNVDRERVKELIANLQAYKGDELLEFVQGLEDDELLALSEEDLDADLQRKLAPYSLNIIEVFTDIKDSQAVEKINAFKGRKLEEETLKQIKQICTESIQPDRMVQLNVFRDSFLNGVALTLYEFGDDTPQFRRQAREVEDEFAEGVDRIVKGMIYGGGLYHNTQWAEGAQAAGSDTDSQSGSGDMPDDLLAEAMDELTSESQARKQKSRKEFWETAGKFINGECDVWEGGAIYFTGIPAPSE